MRRNAYGCLLMGLTSLNESEYFRAEAICIYLNAPIVLRGVIIICHLCLFHVLLDVMSAVLFR